MERPEIQVRYMTGIGSGLDDENFILQMLFQLASE